MYVSVIFSIVRLKLYLIIICYLFFLSFQGTKGLTMFYLQTRNEGGKLNNIEVQVHVTCKLVITIDLKDLKVLIKKIIDLKFKSV